MTRLPGMIQWKRLFPGQLLWERRSCRDEGGSMCMGATSPRRLALAISTACALIVTTPSHAALVSIAVDGAVLRPGSYALPDGARLHDAAVAGQVRADAWFLGAALLRRSAIEPQQKLKAGVLFDLHSNRVHWLADNKPAGVELANRLLVAVQRMPVTGRVLAQLDPLQQLALNRNALLETGDRILYPQRANQVRVTGAVQADCVLPFDPVWQPVDYLKQCPAHELADPSFVDVIQPDGVTQRRGVALWNREPAAVAVGAVLYVPVSERHLAGESPSFNEDFVSLLATQYSLGGRFE
ncbi:Capsule biosynthesis GfcC [Halopseudomonas xinjiangensis]|uniref:Capsule biosynthesis GfcC n=1 Tax=Halopseudomonas xinjiangensis TaxID=487184 RepID=A0A1H1NJZ3_9GAMM|nr:capsule biosynthesis GfcC family protein [Halopseudomonas xinjiangensis]SDR99193.1 Capsule biosynthesis GfcC [Halopseudomonas xinjiangensis]